MSDYLCNYHYLFTPLGDTVPAEEAVKLFNEQVFFNQLQYKAEIDGSKVKIYPTTIPAAALLITFEIIIKLSSLERGDEAPGYPQPYTPMDTHYFIPEGYGVIRRATASGEPRFEPSQKYLDLFPGRVIS